MTLKSWLKRPYPQIDNDRNKLLVSLGIGFICFVFLLVFRPFGLDQVENVGFIFGFGLNAFISMIFHFFVLQYIFPKWFEKELWTIRNQLLFILSITFFISILNYYYNKYVGGEKAPQYGFGYFIYMTYAVGVLPIVVLTYITESLARKKHERIADSIRKDQFTMYKNEESSQRNEEHIIIKSENIEPEMVKLSIGNLLFAEAHGNYSMIYYINEDDELKKIMFRISLKNLQNQLSQFDFILRCHKSFLVNKNNISGIFGNARSLVLKVEEYEIPVSRSFDRSLF